MGKVEAMSNLERPLSPDYLLIFSSSILGLFFHIQTSLFHRKFCLVVYVERDLDISPPNV